MMLTDEQIHQWVADLLSNDTERFDLAKNMLDNNPEIMQEVLAKVRAMNSKWKFSVKEGTLSRYTEWD